MTNYLHEDANHIQYECYKKFNVGGSRTLNEILSGVQPKQVYKFIGWSVLPDLKSDFVIGYKKRGRFLYVETTRGTERYTIEL